MDGREGLFRVDLTDRSMVAQVTELRSVFLDVFTEETLNIGDDKSEVYLYFESGSCIGTARAYPMEDGFKLERIVVKKDHQLKGVGKRIMQLLHEIYVPRLKHGQKIYLHSKPSMAPFYEKCGYVSNGDIYQEDGRHDIDMYLKLNR